VTGSAVAVRTSGALTIAMIAIPVTAVVTLGTAAMVIAIAIVAVPSPSMTIVTRPAPAMTIAGAWPEDVALSQVGRNG
jgi:hypothetical protein